MTRTHITLADLAHACSDQRQLFVDTFGDSAKIGPRNMAKAIKVGLGVCWLERLIPKAARAEYVKARAAAQAEFEKVKAAAWAEFEKVKAAALISALTYAESQS